MRLVEPQVFLIGETTVIQDQLQAYLAHVGAPEWNTDAASDGELLVEVMGRLCYRSWRPGLNPNVTMVRQGNAGYVANLLGSEHGSVLEHVMLNFVFADVSRVLTHELVRHRVGVAYSQESLRYVRLTDLGLWAPTVIRENEHAVEIVVRTFEKLERLQRELSEVLGLDEAGAEFATKKKATSAMRRIAPIGLATTIGFSANLRALRWLLQLRTAPSAEEEIRRVFGMVGEIVTTRYPNVFADFEVTMEEGLPCYRPTHRKV